MNLRFLSSFAFVISGIFLSITYTNSIEAAEMTSSASDYEVKYYPPINNLTIPTSSNPQYIFEYGDYVFAQLSSIDDKVETCELWSYNYKTKARKHFNELTIPCGSTGSRVGSPNASVRHQNKIFLTALDEDGHSQVYSLDMVSQKVKQETSISYGEYPTDRYFELVILDDFLLFHSFENRLQVPGYRLNLLTAEVDVPEHFPNSDDYIFTNSVIYNDTIYMIEDWIFYDKQTNTYRGIGIDEKLRSELGHDHYYPLAVNNKLYFISTNTGYDELWSYESSTNEFKFELSLESNVYSRGRRSDEKGMVVFNEKIYFTVKNQEKYELREIDLSSNTIRLIESHDGWLNNFVTFKGELYYLTNIVQGKSKLTKYSPNTDSVTNISGHKHIYNASNLQVVEERIFFASSLLAQPFSGDVELKSYDGNGINTVVDFSLSKRKGIRRPFIHHQNKVYTWASTQESSELWSFDGKALTQELSTEEPAPHDETLEYDNSLFFLNSKKLEKYSDGNYSAIPTIHEDRKRQNIKHLTIAAEKLFFSAGVALGIDSKPNHELWVYDKKDDKASFIKSFDIEGKSVWIRNMIAYNSNVYMIVALENISGTQIWKYNTSTEEFSQITFLDGNFEDFLYVFDDKLFFVGERQLQTYDDKSNTIKSLMPIVKGGVNAGQLSKSTVVTLNQKMYFYARGATDHYEYKNSLWSYDAETQTISLEIPGEKLELGTYRTLSHPALEIETLWIKEFDNKLYFYGRDDKYGNELRSFDVTDKSIDLVFESKLGVASSKLSLAAINYKDRLLVSSGYYDDYGIEFQSELIGIFKKGTNWQDSDGDGFGDTVDSFPQDSSEWRDSDNDGYGDNIDAFHLDPTEWLDYDSDGYGDNIDAFPEDGSEWLDSDGDGYGDNSDAFPHDATEWLDSDGDGYGDNSDAFPNDATRWQQTVESPKTNDSESSGGGAMTFLLILIALVSLRKSIFK